MDLPLDALHTRKMCPQDNQSGPTQSSPLTDSPAPRSVASSVAAQTDATEIPVSCPTRMEPGASYGSVLSGRPPQANGLNPKYYSGSIAHPSPL
jgi:hypothetical protein